MRIQQVKTDVKKSQQFETINYGVSTENLPLLFQMLRTNLYSDIYGSLIRELASNVADSHIEAGKPDAVGEIEWVDENRLLGVDSQLIIRDFGVGLSPERMKKVYGNYLSSTKRDSNDLTGGFGLGSKTPFAYTDSFFVKTVFDGTEYKYLCYIDESQLGAISLLETKPTTAINGTEVIIPVKDKWHKSKFEESIKQQLTYFKNLRYINIEGPKGEISYEDDNCLVIKDGAGSLSNLHIVLGTVTYRIDFNALGIDSWNSGVRNCYVGLKFKIGELQPTLSREDIYWSDAVKAKVHAKIAKAKKSLRQAIEKELSTITDYGKWYGSVHLQKSESFPYQFTFAQVKTSAEFTAIDGSKLPIIGKSDDWFAGLKLRTVIPYSGYSRRNKVVSKTPEYNTITTTVNGLYDLPVYKYAGTLSARKSLFLFKKHRDGFIVVSDVNMDEMSETEQKRLAPYYKEGQHWLTNLPDFDAIEVPEDEFTATSDDDYKEAYKKILAQRKLEGKFTAKLLYVKDGYDRDYRNCLIFSKYEDKFENVKDTKIIYATQEHTDQLVKLAAMMTYSSDVLSRFGDFKIKFLKISQQNVKQFKLLPNAYDVLDVAKNETVMSEVLRDIATAKKYDEVIFKYKLLGKLDLVNQDLATKYRDCDTFIKSKLEYKRWHESTLLDEVVKFCNEHKLINKEVTAKMTEIEDYYAGAPLLEFVEYKHGCETAVTDYLVSKGKKVDMKVICPKKQTVKETADLVMSA